MKRLMPVICLAGSWIVGCSQGPEPVAVEVPASLAGQVTPAEGLVLANARIIDGKGGVIENGSVVVKDGRIVSVAADAATVPGALVIDLAGKTVMPGLIDAHRHLIQGDPALWMTDRAAIGVLLRYSSSSSFSFVYLDYDFVFDSLYTFIA